MPRGSCSRTIGGPSVPCVASAARMPRRASRLRLSGRRSLTIMDRVAASGRPAEPRRGAASPVAEAAAACEAGRADLGSVDAAAPGAWPRPARPGRSSRASLWRSRRLVSSWMARGENTAARPAARASPRLLTGAAAPWPAEALFALPPRPDEALFDPPSCPKALLPPSRAPAPLPFPFPPAFPFALPIPAALAFPLPFPLPWLPLPAASPLPFPPPFPFPLPPSRSPASPLPPPFPFPPFPLPLFPSAPLPPFPLPPLPFPLPPLPLPRPWRKRARPTRIPPAAKPNGERSGTISAAASESTLTCRPKRPSEAGPSFIIGRRLPRSGPCAEHLKTPGSPFRSAML